MARYTMVGNKRYTSHRAVGFGSLVNIPDKINLETSKHAWENLTFQISEKYAGTVFILTLAKQNKA